MRTPLLIALAAGLPAHAQIACSRPVGPDLILSDTSGVPANYVAANGRDAFSVGTRQTNAGNQMVNYIIGAPTPNAHPITAQGLFRLSTVDGAMRFEQIGQSWAFHGFCALAANNPCSTCSPPPDCSHLGVGCSSPDTASRAGSQVGLGPRWQVNPHTGAFPYPQANPPFSGAIARRLQANLNDINFVDQFFVEVLAVAADDAAWGNQNNNAMYHFVTFSGTGADYTMMLPGAAVPEQPAIAAWKAADPSVTETRYEMPAGGQVILSSRATPIPGGWHYEYALYNMNCDAGVYAVSVGAGGTAPTNIGFHDVSYTDGDGEGNVTRDGTDWPGVYGGGPNIYWQTTPYATNPNANALLWGTLYNFRFDSTRPPMMGRVGIAQWKTFGGPISLAAQTPLPDCYVNCDGSTVDPILNVQDFSCFLNKFASGDTYANCDHSTTPPILNVTDFGCFLNTFAAGCF